MLFRELRHPLTLIAVVFLGITALVIRINECNFSSYAAQLAKPVEERIQQEKELHEQEIAKQNTGPDHTNFAWFYYDIASIIYPDHMLEIERSQRLRQQRLAEKKTHSELMLEEEKNKHRASASNGKDAILEQETNPQDGGIPNHSTWEEVAYRLLSFPNIQNTQPLADSIKLPWSLAKEPLPQKAYAILSSFQTVLEQIHQIASHPDAHYDPDAIPDVNMRVFQPHRYAQRRLVFNSYSQLINEGINNLLLLQALKCIHEQDEAGMMAALQTFASHAQAYRPSAPPLVRMALLDKKWHYLRGQAFENGLFSDQALHWLESLCQDEPQHRISWAYAIKRYIEKAFRLGAYPSTFDKYRLKACLPGAGLSWINERLRFRLAQKPLMLNQYFLSRRLTLDENDFHASMQLSKKVSNTARSGEPLVQFQPTAYYPLFHTATVMPTTLGNFPLLQLDRFFYSQMPYQRRNADTYTRPNAPGVLATYQKAYSNLLTMLFRTTIALEKYRREKRVFPEQLDELSAYLPESFEKYKEFIRYTRTASGYKLTYLDMRYYDWDPEWRTLAVYPISDWKE